jgi:hypothetical protein
VIHRDEAAPVATGEEIPLFFQCMSKSVLCFTERPAFLKYGFNLFRVFTYPLGLLPFGQREIKNLSINNLRNFSGSPIMTA